MNKNIFGPKDEGSLYYDSSYACSMHRTDCCAWGLSILLLFRVAYRVQRTQDPEQKKKMVGLSTRICVLGFSDAMQLVADWLTLCWFVDFADTT